MNEGDWENEVPNPSLHVPDPAVLQLLVKTSNEAPRGTPKQGIFLFQATKRYLSPCCLFWTASIAAETVDPIRQLGLAAVLEKEFRVPHVFSLGWLHVLELLDLGFLLLLLLFCSRAPTNQPLRGLNFLVGFAWLD